MLLTKNANCRLTHRTALNLAAEYTEKTIKLFRAFRVFRGYLPDVS